MSRSICLAALAAAIVLSACTKEIGRDRAVSYFSTHRSHLERVVQEVEQCQPEYKVWLDGEFSCTSAGVDPARLRNAMQQAGARWLWVRRSAAYDGQRPIRSINIVVHSEGFSFAGIIVSFIFEASPSAEARYERTDDGIADIQRMPVTGPPHHWYWQHMRRR
jgi:hypothetical protein